MTTRRLSAKGPWLFALMLLATTLGESAQDQLEQQLSALDARYRDTLVQVRYTQRVVRTTAEPPDQEELTTTGVVVTDDGVVMVSAIVFEPFNQVPHGVGIRFPASVGRTDATISEARVRFIDGSEFAATLLGRDTTADVAFFRVEAEDREFHPAEFQVTGAKVGQQVAVVSLLPEPLGPALAVELNRVQAITARPREGFMVGTSAPDPVGSLVVALDGTVLGFMDALTVPLPDTRPRNPLAFLSIMRDLPKGVGRGFARPAKQFVDASASALEVDPVRRGWLGVEMQAVSGKLAEHLGLPVSKGILVGYVYRNSPAEKAGLEVGDVLTELDGQPIEVSRDDELGTFAEKVLRAGAGAELELGYLRDGERKMATTLLLPAPRSAREAETLKVEELDLTVRELTYDYLATRYLEPDQKGVVVVQPPVAVSSNPNRVAPGDLLVRLDDRDVRDIDALREVIASIRESKPEEVLLFVERGRESFFFAVKPDWD